jgi:alpha-glucosidase (family GH31 glycosyl hydrolase)
LVIAACGGGGSSEVDGSPSPDASRVVSAQVSGLGIEVDEAAGAITIRAPTGEVLLEGLRADGVAPLVGAAFRTGETSWEQGFGAYRPTDQLDPWRVARRFSGTKVDADGTLRFRFAADAEGTGEISPVADGVVRVALRTAQNQRATMAFRCRADEHFLGFGGQARDVDHRGHSFPVFVTEQGNGRVDDEVQPANWFVRGTRHQASVAIPFFLSSAHYGVLADTDRRTYFSLCDPAEAADAWRVEAWDTEIAFYLFHGADPYQVLRRHTDLVGRPPVPPDFVFAPWNDAFGGAAQVRAMAAFLRANDIPSSAIWAEDWAGSSGDSDNLFLDQNWSVDPDLYPDLETLAGELHAAGFKLLGYFSAFAYADRAADGYVNDHYRAGVDNGYFVRTAAGSSYEMSAPRFAYRLALTDLTNPAAVDWMIGFMDATMDRGLDGWMADYGEWMPVDGVTFDGSDPLAFHNRYPVAWQRANERALGARADGVDRIVFARSGYTGSQRIAHQIMWGADQATDWGLGDGIPTVVPIGLGLGIVGLPYYGSDIAGYAEWASNNEGVSPTGTPTTKELFLRWTSLGAFSPVMRTHHGRNAAGNWDLQSDADSTQHFRRYAKLHTRLFPYFRALAETASATGAPLMRAVALEFPDDADAWTRTDQYLLGPSLLVAPVMAEGATSRSVYLPAAQWLPFDGGQPIAGPTTVTATAPATEIPVYARAGTVLALLPERVDTLAAATDSGVVGREQIGADRELRAYLGADGSFEEAGSTYRLVFDHAPGSPAAVAWRGAPLAACAATPMPPCGQVDGDTRSAVAHISGDGELAVTDASGTAATLMTTGGGTGRVLDVTLFW